MSPLCLAALLLIAAPAFSQQPPTYTYDAVVIRPNTSASGSSHVSIHAGSYNGQNVSLKTLLINAYDLQTADQLIGLPGWAAGAHYNVTAKVDAETALHFKDLDHARFEAAQHQASQILLAERFGLKVHHETRELPEYALVQAKGGSKLKPGDELGPKAGGVHTSNHTLTAAAVRMEELTAFLAQQVHRSVVDRTGLTGKFDLALVWSPDDAPAATTDAATTDAAADKAPGLLTALQEQMGLRLEAMKGPVDTIVIDQITQPTEN